MAIFCDFLFFETSFAVAYFFLHNGVEITARLIFAKKVLINLLCSLNWNQFPFLLSHFHESQGDINPRLFRKKALPSFLSCISLSLSHSYAIIWMLLYRTSFFTWCPRLKGSQFCGSWAKPSSTLVQRICLNQLLSPLSVPYLTFKF